jgi:EAL domain-containing protein (putative c-di-GMP-specific phosphodiesterase class I)
MQSRSTLRLAAALEELRYLGVCIAVDDAGAAFASDHHILELTADFIKLDRDVIAGIDSDPAGRLWGQRWWASRSEWGSTGRGGN